MKGYYIVELPIPAITWARIHVMPNTFPKFLPFENSEINPASTAGINNAPSKDATKSNK